MPRIEDDLFFFMYRKLRSSMLIFSVWG